MPSTKRGRSEDEQEHIDTDLLLLHHSHNEKINAILAVLKDQYPTLAPYTKRFKTQFQTSIYPDDPLYRKIAAETLIDVQQGIYRIRSSKFDSSWVWTGQTKSLISNSMSISNTASTGTSFKAHEVIYTVKGTKTGDSKIVEALTTSSLPMSSLKGPLEIGYITEYPPAVPGGPAIREIFIPILFHGRIMSSTKNITTGTNVNINPIYNVVTDINASAKIDFMVPVKINSAESILYYKSIDLSSITLSSFSHPPRTDSQLHLLKNFSVMRLTITLQEFDSGVATGRTHQKVVDIPFKYGMVEASTTTYDPGLNPIRKYLFTTTSSLSVSTNTSEFSRQMPIITSVSYAGNSLENYLVFPVTFSWSMTNIIDKIKTVLPDPSLGIAPFRPYWVGDTVGLENTGWLISTVDKIEFNEVHADRQAQLTQSSTTDWLNYDEYVSPDPVFSIADFSFTIGGSISYDIFKPAIGQTAQQYIVVSSQQIVDKLTDIETKITELQNNDILLAEFSRQLYEAIKSNSASINSLITSKTQQDTRANMLSRLGITFSGSSLVMKLIEEIPGAKPILEIANSALDLALPYFADSRSNVGTGYTIVRAKQQAKAMAAIDTTLIYSVLAKANLSYDNTLVHQLSKSSLALIKNISDRYRLGIRYKENFPTLWRNDCIYYVRKISQIPGVGAIGWNLTTTQYNREAMLKNNLVPAHGFLEITTTHASNIVPDPGDPSGVNGSIRQHKYIVSTGDFNSLIKNIALLTIMRSSAGSSLFNYKKLTRTWNSAIKEFEWDTDPDADINPATGLKYTYERYYIEAFDSMNPSTTNTKWSEDSRHYTVAECECNVDETALDTFLEYYKDNAPAYNLFTNNCQMQSEDVMNFIVQGAYPDWWDAYKNKSFVQAVVDKRVANGVYTESFKTVIDSVQITEE